MAHPGRTAADGCHYCRTNCDKWGEAWNVRHCHNEPSSPPPVIVTTKPKQIQPTVVKPIVTKKPIVTPKPTRKPIIKVTPAPVPSCSADFDGICPKKCTAGNDADCCFNKTDMKWYENWGCYPKKLLCSDVGDGVCHSYCTAGNDVDCCEQKSGYMWYVGKGCFIK